MTYLVIDTETTGLDPLRDRIVELAAVNSDHSEVAQFTALCDPGVKISLEAMACHHITEDMILERLKPDEVYSQMSNAMQITPETVFVAHNVQFDKGFISQLEGCNPEQRWICTYVCAKHLWPEAPGFSNQMLRYWLCIEVDIPEGLYPHRALYDCIVTRGILERMLTLKTLEELVELTTIPIPPKLLETCQMTKYRGVLWKDVPRDYLRWILTKTDFDADTLHTARYYLNLAS